MSIDHEAFLTDVAIASEDLYTCENHFEIIDLMCKFAYECGREAAKCGLERICYFDTDLELQTILAWEQGYDSYQGS